MKLLISTMSEAEAALLIRDEFTSNILPRQLRSHKRSEKAYHKAGKVKWLRQTALNSSSLNKWFVVSSHKGSNSYVEWERKRRVYGTVSPGFWIFFVDSHALSRFSERTGSLFAALHVFHMNNGMIIKYDEISKNAVIPDGTQNIACSDKDGVYIGYRDLVHKYDYYSTYLSYDQMSDRQVNKLTTLFNLKK